MTVTTVMDELVLDVSTISDCADGGVHWRRIERLVPDMLGGSRLGMRSALGLQEFMDHVARLGARSRNPQDAWTALRLSCGEQFLAADVSPGRHGVYLTRGEYCGVFLPQVAIEYGWDRETFLSELCRKAMLPPDAWRHPETTLMLFEAEVFSELSTHSP